MANSRVVDVDFLKLYHDQSITENDLRYMSADAEPVDVVTYGTVSDPDTAWSLISTERPRNRHMMIVRNSDASEASGYVWSDSNNKWIAFSGNVNADNVYMTTDITMAGDYTNVGNATKGSNTSTAVLNWKGKSLTEVMSAIFTKELQPNKVNPSMTIVLNEAGKYEVGTTVIPTYKGTLNVGSYTYGPATGVTGTWEITDTDGHSSSDAIGSFPSFYVSDDTAYNIIATVAYTDGVKANTNIGNESSLYIVGDSITHTSQRITGYRSFFYGALDNDNTLTSDIIRGLTNGGDYDSAKSITINPIADVVKYVVAIPSSSTRNGLTSAVLPNSLNAQVKSQYVKTTSGVQVNDSQGNNPVAYDLYVYQPSKIGSNEVHNITLG